MSVMKSRPTNHRPSTTFERVGAGQPAPMGIIPALLIEMRPNQWVKNLACLAGVIFSGKLFEAASWFQAMVGFASYCLASSAIYILNDFFDREKDRLNPRTASRPLASGALATWVAAVAFVALLALAGLGAAWLETRCIAVLATYVIMNVLYTLRLKQIVIADVMCIALGFVFRVMFGVYAVHELPTPWIVLCIFFLALFLGFAKRRSELTSPYRARSVLEKYGAGYLDVLLTMSATLAILCFSMFTVLSHKNSTLVVTIVPVVYCIYRYMLHVIIHAKGESPERLLLSDKRIWVGVAAWLLSYIAIHYGNIRLFVEAS